MKSCKGDVDRGCWPRWRCREKEPAGSRSDGFWTTLGKQLVKSVVPAATRLGEKVLKDSLKGGRGGGGGFGGGITG